MQGMEPTKPEASQARSIKTIKDLRFLLYNTHFGTDFLTTEQRIKQFTDLFLNNLDALNFDSQFKKTIILESCSFIDKILETFLKRFDELVITQTNGVCSFLCTIAQINHPYIRHHYQDNRAQIVNLIHKNLAQFAQDSNNLNNLYNISFFILGNKTTSILGKMKLCAAIAPQVKKINPLVSDRLLRETKNWQLAHAISQLKDKTIFEPATITLANEIFEKTYVSPTQRHLHLKGLHLEKQFLSDPELHDLYQNFLIKEKELNKNKFYTFVHGQRRELYFSEKLYTFLWEQRKKQSTNNFLFAHAKNLIETDDAKLKEDVLRRTILMAGTQQDSDNQFPIDIERRKMILFMNYALFANSSNPGSDSSYYIYFNCNSIAGTTITLSPNRVFSILGYEWLYKKYQKEINALNHDYTYLSHFGNLLLIAIPQDTIKKYVYLARSGGLSETIHIDNIGETSDIKIILETLLNHPEKISETDRLEFCLIMSQAKGGLDPSTGIQIHPLLSGLPNKLKELQEREKILLEKMKHEIKEKDQEKSMNRAAIIAKHILKSITDN